MGRTIYPKILKTRATPPKIILWGGLEVVRVCDICWNFYIFIIIQEQYTALL